MTATGVLWARVSHAAALQDGRLLGLARRPGRAEVLLLSGPGSSAERLPCAPPLPEAAAVAPRLRRCPSDNRVLVASPTSLGVVTPPSAHEAMSSLAGPTARCVCGRGGMGSGGGRGCARAPRRSVGPALQGAQTAAGRSLPPRWDSRSS